MRDLEFNIRGTDKTKPAFDSAGRNARAFNGELDMASRGFQMAGNAARFFAAGFTLTAVAEFGRTVRGVITEAADLVDLADKVGVATGDLQRMVFGFSQAGVAASEVDQILTQWSKRIGEAHTKGGQLADIFKANGLSLTDSEGRLRSSVDLMRSYAELVANAGSEQEQMTLATAAFGKAGGSMVLALKDGTAGFDELMKAADEAGGVMEDSVLRTAADIDDEFNRMWRSFEIGAKTAVLNSVAALSQLRGVFADLNSQYENAARQAEIGRQLGAMAGKQPQPTKGGRLESPIDQRVDAAHGDVSEKSAADEALARELRSRYGKKTIIPSGDNDNESRSRSAKAAKEQESAYDRVIEKLREEQQVLGLTDIARRVAIEQQRAGVEATSAEGKAIGDLVRSIETQQAAYDKAAEASEFFSDALKDGFSDLIPEIETGNAALDRFLNTLIEASAEALLFGSGPLSGLFGGGKGLFGGVFGGGRAVGGTVDPWRDYLVGENGPEIMRIGSRGGRVGSADAPGSATGGAIKVDVGVSVDEEGNLKAYVKSVAHQEGSSAARAAVTDYDRAMPDRVQQINRNPRRR